MSSSKGEDGARNPHFSSILPLSTSTSLPRKSKTLLDPQCCKETARHRSEENSQDGDFQHPKAHLTQTFVVSAEACVGPPAQGLTELSP